MFTHQEKPNENVTPVPDVTLVSDGEGEDKNIVDLEAVARVATAKLEKDLADAKARKNRIMWKKQEWVDRLKKKKEDEEAAGAKKKADEEARKKVLVQPPVSSVLPVFLGPETNLVSRLGRLFRPRTQWQGCPNAR